MQELRRIEFFRHYFIEFYQELPLTVQRKYEYVFVIVRQADRIPVKFFKKVTGTDGLFEIRVEFSSNIYRTFCCLDGEKVVVLFNSFQKKSQKTPSNHLKKALELQKQYYGEKK